MASNILSIGQSALAAAQVGISTTGHNIANVSTPGYSRQVVIQGAADAQNFGYGYVGQGTQVSAVKRIYSEVLARQVVSAQSSTSALTAYHTQMVQIDDMLSDSAAGLSPALQDFFNSVQTLTGNPGDSATRQAALSSAESLVDRFHSIGDRLSSLRESVNTQLTAGIIEVNTYAKSIAKLNDVIEKAYGAHNSPPNDLLDQRDQLVLELSKIVKTTVVNQDGGKYNLFIGSGLPLVVGTQTFALTTANSPTDGGRLDVAYVANGKTTLLSPNSLPGGAVGGLLEFREQSLDPIRNQLGLIAVTVAQTFNEQHAQGLDALGKPGGGFYAPPVPLITKNVSNTGNATVTSQISNVSALTSSDYSLKFDGSNYTIARLSDNQVQTFASLPQTIDGITMEISAGAMQAGDDFLIQPTANGTADFKLLISNTTKIAAGAPVLNAANASANTGTGNISALTVSTAYASAPLGAPVTLIYNSGSNTLTGFPAGQAVTVTTSGVSTTYPAGTPVPYNSGDTIEFAGIKFQMAGLIANGDQFTLTPNTTSASGDNRNALQLAALQASSVMANGTSTFEGAFNQLVSLVGNKTRELQVTSKAENQMLTQAVAAKESESGVNLDEEATNLLRYQQAYQAAGKMMQIASQLFDVLLTIGR